MSPLVEEPLLIDDIDVYPPLPYPRRDLPVGGRLGHFAKEWGKITQDSWVLSVVKRGYKIPFVKKPILSPSPHFFKQSASPVLEEEVQKLLQKRAVESINPEDPGFYSRIFLVLKRNGKFRLIIDLSRLNKFLNIQSFSMETVNKVRNAIYPKDWAISLDLTDAYLHVPIHVTSRKYLRFCLKGRVFQFRALQFGLATSPFVFTQLMVVIATHLRVRAIILFPYLDDWLVRNQRRLQLIKDREFTLRLISSLGLIINPEKSELIPSQNFTFIGMEFIRQYCPSSLGQSTMYSRPNRLVSETSCCHSKNVSLFTGETECFCSICRFRQTAPSPSSDGSFRSVETACSSTRTQNICYRTDKTSSGMVVGQGQIFTRSCSQTTSSSAHSLYRCELFGLGCSSGTGRTHVSWSLASEPISSTHQHPRNEGYSSSSQRVPTHSVQFLSNDSDRQFFCHGLSPKGGRHPFTNFMRRGLGNSPLVSREWNISQGQTHSWQNQYFGRPPVSVRQANINRMVPESVNLQFDFSDVGTSQHSSFCDTAEQQASTICLPNSGQQGSSNRCYAHELGRDSRICVSPISHHSSDPHQDSHAPMQNSVDRSSLASENLVSRVASSIDSCSNISSGNSRFFNSKNRNRKLCASSSKSPVSFSSRLDIVKRSVTNKKFSRDIAEHVSKARRPSTRKVYKAKWGVFSSWCRTRKITPSKASVSNVADFLLYLFEVKKCQASTIKCYRSMISNTLKFRSGINVGSDPIISELMKAFELQRPVQRSLLPKWDLGCVLVSLCKEPYEPLHKTSLLNLTRKTVFLLALATASRVSEIHAFSVGSEHLRFNNPDGSVSLRTQTGFLAKNQLPSRCRRGD